MQQNGEFEDKMQRMSTRSRDNQSVLIGGVLHRIVNCLLVPTHFVLFCTCLAPAFFSVVFRWFRTYDRTVELRRGR